MDVLTFEICLTVNSEIIKQVTSVGLSLFKYIIYLQTSKQPLIQLGRKFRIIIWLSLVFPCNWLG